MNNFFGEKLIKSVNKLVNILFNFLQGKQRYKHFIKIRGTNLSNYISILGLLDNLVHFKHIRASFHELENF